MLKAVDWVRRSLISVLQSPAEREEMDKLRKGDETDKVDPVSVVLQALDRAADLAVTNVPRLEGRTLVVVDESGSMMGSGRQTERSNHDRVAFRGSDPEG